MIEPTEQNIILFILARGFCPKCGGPPGTAEEYPSEYYCGLCWTAIADKGRREPELKEWRKTIDMWKDAFRKYNVT